MNPGPDSPERDPALERAWRAHSREAPPPELDRAILAAAHRAVGSGPQDASKAAAEVAMEATRPQRWWMPLAAAATIGVIAIGILQLTTPEQSLVAPNERVAAVAPRGAADKVSASPAGQSADDARKERDAPLPAVDIASAEQKKKQEAQPPPQTPAPSPSKPAAPIARETQGVTGKLAARPPEPQPFPAAIESRKNAAAEVKRDAQRETAAKAADAVTQAPAAAPQSPPPPAMAEERALARKDTAGERQQLAADTDQSTASAPPGRSGPSSAGAVSSFAAAPSVSQRARDSGLARNEAPAQAAPAAAPPPVLAKTLVSSEELRAKARDPEAWIVRIRKLRDEGNTAEALRELREFRNLVPDAERRLPADLLAWANTLK